MTIAFGAIHRNGCEIEIRDISSEAFPALRKVVVRIFEPGVIRFFAWVEMRAPILLVVSEGSAGFREHAWLAQVCTFLERGWDTEPVKDADDEDLVEGIVALLLESMSERFEPPVAIRPQDSACFVRKARTLHLVFDALGLSSLPFPAPFKTRLDIVGGRARVLAWGCEDDVRNKVSKEATAVMTAAMSELGLHLGHSIDFDRQGFGVAMPALMAAAPPSPNHAESAHERLENEIECEALLARRPDLVAAANALRDWCADEASAVCAAS